jgi:hypothetical protein
LRNSWNADHRDAAPPRARPSIREKLNRDFFTLTSGPNAARGDLKDNAGSVMSERLVSRSPLGHSAEGVVLSAEELRGIVLAMDEANANLSKRAVEDWNKAQRLEIELERAHKRIVELAALKRASEPSGVVETADLVDPPAATHPR